MHIDKAAVNRILPEVLAFLMVVIPILGYNTSAGGVFVWAVFVPFALAEWHFYHIKPTISINKHILWGFIFFTALVLLAGIINLDWISTRKGFRYATYAVPFFLIIYLAQHFEVKRGFFLGIVASLLILCGVGFFQWHANTGMRMMSIYPNPNSFGRVLELLSPFLFVYILLLKKAVPRICLIALLAASLICLFLSGCRGAMAGLCCGLVCAGGTYLLAFWRKFSWKRKVIILGVCIAVLVAGVTTIAKVEEYRHYADGGERLMMLEASYHMWEDHKLTGVGMNNWASNYYGAYRPEGQHEQGLNMPHNMIAYYMSTTGIIGTTGYFLYMFLTFWGLWQLLKKQKRMNPMYMAGVVIFFAFFVSGMVDGTFIGPRVARPYYLLLGYALAGLMFGKTEENL